ncbi:MAG: hypothetical protein IEMM0008_0445 [bacterium]|nr:MAG: hypothetical protein IEMM0008_0445 [bacterium]
MANKIKYYTDEHVSKAVVKGLRGRGLDVLTSQEAKMLGVPDEEHLSLAADLERVLFTQDDDFLRLHAKGISHCGIVYASQQASIGDVIRGLTLIYQVLDQNDMKNHIEFL